MDLALNRKLAGRSLPEGSRIIAAVNEGEEYQLTDLDPALVSRFNIFRFEPTVEEWILWAGRNNVDARVISFIRDNGMWLDKDPTLEEGEDTGLDKTPDRRAWKRVSDVIQGRDVLTDNDIRLISSVVGVKAANVFIKNLKQNKVISAKDLLNDFNAQVPILMELSLHQFTILNEDIFIYLETNLANIGNPGAIASNLSKYYDFLKSGNKNEVIASFAHYLNDSKYENAGQFIVINAYKVFRAIVNYTQSIKV